MCAIHDDFECRIRRLERSKWKKDSDSDSDFSDEYEWKRDEENWKRGKGGRTSLVFVTQHTNVTSQGDPQKSDVKASSGPSSESEETENVPPTASDETDATPSAPARNGVQKSARIQIAKPTKTDETYATASAPPSDGSQKAEEVPIYRDKYYQPRNYNQYLDKYGKDENAYGFGDRNVAPAAYKQQNDSKLEVQSLLRMLQTSPY